MNVRLRPLTGQVLIRILPPETRTASGLELPQVNLSPEERQQRSHNPEMPPPDLGIVEAIGPWPLKNGMFHLPPFGLGAKVVVREGSGIKCDRNIGERLKLIRSEDVLAVLSEV